MSVSAKLASMNVELPPVVPPVAAYIPASVQGTLVFTSGQLPVVDGYVVSTGPLSDGASDEAIAQAQKAARACALNAIAAAADIAGGVDKLARVVKATVFVASSQGFVDQAKVANGASEFLQEVFSSAHARSAVGVVGLPMNATVEVELIFELA
ncbi:MAG: RidA family protein [Actinomycetaceae bacterium]|nr:RidA family protein [Actinomycetaceae bacterium]